MIVGTAGHVNHGKTTLVEALTGVDCDRLEQERARGMTIELGFAPWTLPDGRRVSVIDVPGHARFARTMATGAMGVDLALLVVAADEGWMPQTREHVATCRVLGIARAVVALTRAERVDDVAASVEAVRSELDRTHFAGAPVVPVVAPRGEGLEALAAAVVRALPEEDAVARGLPALLPVDRSFTVRGFGTVVTGSLLRGRVAVGDRVAIRPAGIEGRVRQLHVHGEPVESACSRTRLAVNLADVRAEQARRGAVVGAPGAVGFGRMFDAEIEWLAHRAEPLRRARALGFVCGATRALARVICDAPIAPGSRGTGRLQLDRDVPLVGGLRFVLRGERDPLHGAVVGGGRVIDAAPPRRRAPAVRAALAERPDVDVLREEAGARGLEVESVGYRLGVPPLAADASRLAEGVIEDAATAALEAVRAHLAEHKGAAGTPRHVISRSAAADAALERLVARGTIVREGSLVRPHDHRVASPDELDALAARVLDEVESDGLAGPRETDLGARLGTAPDRLRRALERLEGSEAIVRSQGFCFAGSHAHALRARVARALVDGGELPFGWLKAELGLSRKHAMPLWVWLDRCGVTTRRGDGRIAGPAAAKHA